MFGPNFLYPHKCNNITDPCTLEKPNYKFRFTYKDLDNNIVVSIITLSELTTHPNLNQILLSESFRSQNSNFKMKKTH